LTAAPLIGFAAAFTWLIVLAVVGVGSGVTIAVAAGRDYRWVRWPLAFVCVVGMLLVVSTAPWPDGLGMESCEQVPNPALAADPNATPTIKTCSDLSANAAPVILALALAALFLAPDLGEIGVPGLFSLRSRLAAQERTAAAQDQQLTKLSNDVRSISQSASSAQAVSAPRTNVYLGNILRGGEGPLSLATAHIAKLVLDRLTEELMTALGDPQADVAVYRQVPEEGCLRQHELSAADVTDFRPGYGATGQAFSTRQVIVVHGDAVHNADYGLTAQQQDHFQAARIVGSAPLFDFDDLSRVIGVLTCISTTAPEPDTQAVVERWTRELPSRAPYFAAYLVTFGLDVS
jgi:GAF domain